MTRHRVFWGLPTPMRSGSWRSPAKGICRLPVRAIAPCGSGNWS